MCHTQYRPDVPLPEQVSDLLHQMTTWQDAASVIEAQVPTVPLRDAQALGDLDPTIARLELRAAAAALATGRHHALAAFRLLVAADPAGPTQPGAATRDG